jgi:hypothetical protein
MKKLNKTFWTLLMGVTAMFVLLSYILVTTPMVFAVSQYQQATLAADCSNPCTEQGITHGCTTNYKGTCTNGVYAVCDAGYTCEMQDGNPVCEADL